MQIFVTQDRDYDYDIPTSHCFQSTSHLIHTLSSPCTRSDLDHIHNGIHPHTLDGHNPPQNLSTMRSLEGRAPYSWALAEWSRLPVLRTFFWLWSSLRYPRLISQAWTLKLRFCARYQIIFLIIGRIFGRVYSGPTFNNRIGYILWGH
jgi:hypothetical protein